MRKFVIYSDFDGVHNIPVRQSVPSCPGTVSVLVETDSTLLEPSQFINFDEQVRDDFNALLATGLYDLTWHTTWNDGNNILEASRKMGIDVSALDAIVSEPNFNHEARGKRDWTEWKARYIIEDQKKNPRPFIWIDDEAPKHWADEVVDNVRDIGLIVQTESEVGLTRYDILKIVEWSQKNFR